MNLQGDEPLLEGEAIDALIVDKIVREAVDPTYVEELEDDYVGYSGQTIKTIVQHL